MPCKISKINEVDSSNREEKPQETNLGASGGVNSGNNGESGTMEISPQYIARLRIRLENKIREPLLEKIDELRAQNRSLKDSLINCKKALAIARRIIKGRDVPL